MENTQNLTHITIPTNGITLHVVQAGPTDGEVVILLHGFPEFWRGWLKQIPALTEAGYRVWIPDQRGYNLSDKPKAVRAYDVDTLARDVVGSIDASGQQKVCPGRPRLGCGGGVVGGGKTPRPADEACHPQRAAPGGDVPHPLAKLGANAKELVHLLLPTPTPARGESASPQLDQRHPALKGSAGAARSTMPIWQPIVKHGPNRAQSPA